MNLLNLLKPSNGEIPSAEDLTEAAYARLPFQLLGNGQAPFSVWRRPDSRVPGELEGFWKACAASYQLCTFHAVNAVTVGNDFAERILAHQKRFLDGLQDGLGGQHEAEIRKLYAFAKAPMEITGKDGEPIEIPCEWRIAVDFLLTGADSPFRDETAVFSIEGAPSFPEDLDVALALDLEFAWDQASELFARMAQAVG